MEWLRIEYETGYMELNVEMFFPCVVQKARKIAPLISRYCPEDVREELLSDLRSLADGYGALSKMYREKAGGLSENSSIRKHWNARARETERLQKRMESDIRIIFGGSLRPK